MKRQLSPEDKANDMLSRKLFEDAEKDILQIILLCETQSQIVYWKEVHEMTKKLYLAKRLKEKKIKPWHD